MTMKEFLKTMTEEAAVNFFKDARRVPADKVEWKPLDNGRSVLSQAQECAQCPLWTISSLAGILGVDDPFAGQTEDTSKSLTTLDACEEECRKNLARLYAAIDAFPEDRLGEKVTIPYGTFTCYQLLSLALWNFHYHQGQINFIQTLYGDFEG